MFMTLRDPNRALGMANIFCLKIYDDPFMYPYFLKISISALIDAGAIPRNDQPGPNTIIEEYDQIQERLLSLLDSGHNAGAKNVVLQITNYWRERSRVSYLDIKNMTPSHRL